MKYRGYTIEKSGSNFRVRDERGSYFSEIAATVKSAKKWIDADSFVRAWKQRKGKA